MYPVLPFGRYLTDRLHRFTEMFKNMHSHRGCHFLFFIGKHLQQFRLIVFFNKMGVKLPFCKCGLLNGPVLNGSVVSIPLILNSAMALPSRLMASCREGPRPPVYRSSGHNISECPYPHHSRHRCGCPPLPVFYRLPGTNIRKEII